MDFYGKQYLAETPLSDPINESGEESFGSLLAVITHGTALRLMKRGSFSEKMSSCLPHLLFEDMIPHQTARPGGTGKRFYRGNHLQARKSEGHGKVHTPIN